MKKLSIEDGKEILKKHFTQQHAVVKNSGDENEIMWVELKFSHSHDVFEMSKKLLDGDEELKVLSDDDKLLGKLGALLHDVGRFYEVGEKRLNGVPHGIYGADSILEKIEGVDDLAILLPVKYHDDLYGKEKTLEELAKSNISQEQKDLTFKLLKLVMDSDKLANFHLFKDCNRRYFLNLPKEIAIADACLNSFKNRELVKREDRKSVLDQLIFYISWSYDLNYQFSKDLVRNESYMKAFTNMMREIIEQEAKNPAEKKDVLTKLEMIESQLAQDGLL